MKFHIGHLLGLSAVILAISAAFFSVTGLGQLFAGASIAVIIMASALEFSKVIIATFLHRYWGEVSRILKIYLTIGLIILVGITSAGIYGFLSSAYQKTATNLEAHEGQIGLVDNKIQLVEDKIESNTKLSNSKLERYDRLMNLRSLQETRLDSMINRRYFSNAEATRNEIVKASDDMATLQSDVDEINTENSKLKDSIGKFQLQIMEMKASSSVAGEVGPLKYMAELTGQSMDVIVNYFTLLLIFVFDPLAISLVIATNWVFERKRREKEDKKVEPVVKEPVVNEEPVVNDDELNKLREKYLSSEWNKVVADDWMKKQKCDPVTGEIDLSGFDGSTITQDVFIPSPGTEDDEDDYNEPEMGPDSHDIEVELDVNDIEVVDAEEVKVEEPVVEPVVESEPTKKRLSLEDIEQVGPYSKGERGFSTNIPEPRVSTERRIGTNKILKDGHQAVYKNNKKDND